MEPEAPSTDYSSLNVFDLLENLPTEKVEAMVNKEYKKGDLMPGLQRMILQVRSSHKKSGLDTKDLRVTDFVAGSSGQVVQSMAEVIVSDDSDESEGDEHDDDEDAQTRRAERRKRNEDRARRRKHVEEAKAAEAKRKLEEWHREHKHAAAAARGGVVSRGGRGGRGGVTRGGRGAGAAAAARGGRGGARGGRGGRGGASRGRKHETKPDMPDGNVWKMDIMHLMASRTILGDLVKKIYTEEKAKLDAEERQKRIAAAKKVADDEAARRAADEARRREDAELNKFVIAQSLKEKEQEEKTKEENKAKKAAENAKRRADLATAKVIAANEAARLLKKKKEGTLQLLSHVTVFSAKAHQTAVVLVPPEDQWAPIQKLRSQYDKAYDRWMPHINLLYPFVPESQFSDALNALHRAVNVSAKISPQRIVLKEVGHFSQGKSGVTVHLKPHPESCEWLSELQMALEVGVPICNDLSARGGFQPHLTLAQFPSKSKMDEVLKDEQLSVEWEAAEVLLIARSGASDPFQVKMRLKIAASDEDSGKQTDGSQPTPPASTRQQWNKPTAAPQAQSPVAEWGAATEPNSIDAEWGADPVAPAQSYDWSTASLAPSVQPKQPRHRPRPEKTAADEDEAQKTEIGERVYPKVHESYPDEAGKITGMLLDFYSYAELDALLTPAADEETSADKRLDDRIREAMNLLDGGAEENSMDYGDEEESQPNNAQHRQREQRNRNRWADEDDDSQSVQSEHTDEDMRGRARARARYEREQEYNPAAHQSALVRQVFQANSDWSHPRPVELPSNIKIQTGRAKSVTTGYYQFNTVLRPAGGAFQSKKPP